MLIARITAIVGLHGALLPVSVVYEVPDQAAGLTN